MQILPYSIPSQLWLSAVAQPSSPVSIVPWHILRYFLPNPPWITAAALPSTLVSIVQSHMPLNSLPLLNVSYEIVSLLQELPLIIIKLVKARHHFQILVSAIMQVQEGT